MVSWILIAILLAIVLFVSVKFKEMGAHAKLTLVLFLIGVFVITVGYVWFVVRPDLTTYQGFLDLGKSYFSWLSGVFHNMGSVTGYAVKHDWGAVNMTAAP
ncbi:MAG: hypothetical protein MUF61_01840 [archaeon]|jgi:FtsH-binding integral membrane protein|nr:hypothetical protein [archaeon]